MHRGLVLSVLMVVLVALIQTAYSLPPDFFRNGLVRRLGTGSQPVPAHRAPSSSWWSWSSSSSSRPKNNAHISNGKRPALASHKRSSLETDLTSSACSYCGTFSKEFEFECRQDVGSRQKDCMVAYFDQVEKVLSKRGWK